MNKRLATLINLTTLSILATSLGGCASGDACRDAGHVPGTGGYASCERQVSEDRARGARKLANEMPIGGYGPTRF